MRIPHNRFGMTINPIGAHCTMQYKDRTLIGTIVDIYRSETRGVTLLKVKHFDGSDWPVDPSFVLVDVLERDYEEQAHAEQANAQYAAYLAKRGITEAEHEAECLAWCDQQD